MSRVYDKFNDIYKNLRAPVLVCAASDTRRVVYANAGARLAFNPYIMDFEVFEGSNADAQGRLDNYFKFKSPLVEESFFDSVKSIGQIQGLDAELVSGGKEEAFSLTGTSSALDGEEYIVLYVERKSEAADRRIPIDEVLSFTFHIAYQIPDPQEAINRIMAYIGDLVKVSRVYIFEEIDPLTTANTYEWCAEGVEPAIDGLQDLKKDEYGYDNIVNNGMYIKDDIRELPEEERAILEVQDIKALAIIPLFLSGRALGYIGFDDCEKYRRWDTTEVSLLSNIANIIVSLLNRRNNEKKLSRSYDILRKVSDSVENSIYVSDINTYDVVFVNDHLKKELGREENEIVGRPCWQAVRQGMSGKCDFCPLKVMLDGEGNIIKENHSWEYFNESNGKWYDVRNSIVDWTDGRKVHIESTVDITGRKNYEQQLETFASTDMLTGAHTRAWGYKLMEEMLSSTLTDKNNMSLVFMDINGLNYVNDTFGHGEGDKMLAETVEVVRSRIRRNDVICRWGGDEFVVLLQCQIPIAHKIMASIEERIRDINATGKNIYTLSVSFGIIEFKLEDGETIDSLISKADAEMYEDKEKKRAEMEKSAEYREYIKAKRPDKA